MTTASVFYQGSVTVLQDALQQQLPGRGLTVPEVRHRLVPIGERMATTTVNGGSSAEGNPPVSMPGTGKQQMSKPAATGGKAVDTNRKQTSNPSEGAQR